MALQILGFWKIIIKCKQYEAQAEWLNQSLGPVLSGMSVPCIAAEWNTNFMRDLLETRLQIELWCNYELFLCVLQDWAACHWAKSTSYQTTTGGPDCSANPPFSQLTIPFDCQFHKLNSFSLIYDIISGKGRVGTIKHPSLSDDLFLQWPYMLAYSWLSADLIQS